MFLLNESYKHKCAKEIFKQWCQERSKTPWPTNYQDAIYWRAERAQEAWLEYPIVSESKINSALFNWDEIWIYSNKEENYDFVPSYAQCIKNNLYPIAVVDVVLPHKGRPWYCIEICHKNPVSDDKIRKLHAAGIKNLMEIDAEWILCQTRIPFKLQIKRWLIRDGIIQIESQRTAHNGEICNVVENSCSHIKTHMGDAYDTNSVLHSAEGSLGTSYKCEICNKTFDLYKLLIHLNYDPCNLIQTLMKENKHPDEPPPRRLRHQCDIA